MEQSIITLQYLFRTKLGMETMLLLWIVKPKKNEMQKFKKLILGNGKVVWTDGNITLAESEEEALKLKQLPMQTYHFKTNHF